MADIPISRATQAHIINFMTSVDAEGARAAIDALFEPVALANNLTSDDADAALSAAQGVVIKAVLDGLTSQLSSLTGAAAAQTDVVALQNAVTELQDEMDEQQLKTNVSDADLDTAAERVAKINQIMADADNLATVDIAGLDAALLSINTSITSLSADLAGKADSTHTHVINDVTGLQESLDDLDAQTLDVSGAATIADQDTSDPESVVNYGQGDGRYGVTYTRYKPTDETKTSDDVLIMDTDLVVNDLPAGNYILEAVIKHNNDSNITGDTGGIKVRIHGGDLHHLHAVNYQTNIHTPTSSINGVAGTIGFSLGVDEQNKFSNTMIFKGVIEVNNLSDVGVQWAQNTSSTSILVLNRGSYLTLTKIN